MRWLLAAGAVITCFLIPIGHADATTLFDMQDKTTTSFLLMIAVLLISHERWAITVASIELGLNLINFIIIADWPKINWLVAHYGHIQSIAFALEIVVILGATAHGSRPIFSSFADYCRRVLHLAGR